jgi:hypothetical protein
MPDAEIFTGKPAQAPRLLSESLGIRPAHSLKQADLEEFFTSFNVELPMLAFLRSRY